MSQECKTVFKLHCLIVGQLPPQAHIWICSVYNHPKHLMYCWDWDCCHVFFTHQPCGVFCLTQNVMYTKLTGESQQNLLIAPSFGVGNFFGYRKSRETMEVTSSYPNSGYLIDSVSSSRKAFIFLKPDLSATGHWLAQKSSWGKKSRGGNVSSARSIE
jgi:hypothetical protein